MILQVIGAFLGVVGMSIVIGVPKKLIIYSGFVGAFGWWVYLMMEVQYPKLIILQAFTATMVVSLISHICARLLKAPGTIFLIPGIMPMVPGAGMYRTAYYAFKGNSTVASYHLSQTVQIAGAIALAIFIMDSIFRIIQLKKQWNR
ncbi:threonine/serine exporter family protein [Anaerosporobacter faecicola]|uniref:threonine/serine exporter family protein n=1 Tax=Anaerosporobacter faecicola TaxID=2718714 RepID=UPI00143B0A1C|nr:threonine/serine exporter family protein [Anaerosporobacter faecicola]